LIPVAEPSLSGNELAYVTDCISSGWISSIGKYIPRFENEFADYCSTSHGIAVCNGTTALHLALRTLNIGPGDEVILPSLTFIATANAVMYTGATPVFADSEESTWNLAPEEVNRRITSKTRAIIAVHLYGHPVDMDPILDISEKHGISVIEDAAEAHGARYKGRRVGGMGIINCFSFYGNKIITTGEGGMLTTQDAELARRARFLRDHAMSPARRYWHPEIGYNYRMTNLQAALGVAQLEQIERFIAHKREIASIYNDLLKDTPGLVLPPNKSWAEPVYWMYSVLVTPEFPLSRDGLADALRAQGIDNRPFFVPIHQNPPYDTGAALPVAEQLSQRGLNLPSGVKLTSDDLLCVVNAIHRCL
jgi:perosamine synthetase